MQKKRRRCRRRGEGAEEEGFIAVIYFMVFIPVVECARIYVLVSLRGSGT